MLVLLARLLILPGLADHQFGKVPVPDVLGSALREEVYVVLVVLELLFLLQLVLLLSLSLLYPQLLEVAVPPLIRVYVLVVFLYPRKRLLLSHFYSFIVVFLHQLLKLNNVSDPVRTR